METIITAKALWEGYDPTTEQLDVNFLRTQESDGLVTKRLYFTGRTFADGSCSRIFATSCSKNTNGARPALLLVGDYHEPMHNQAMRVLAERGFTVLSIDFAGNGGDGLHTLYPSCLSYCNANQAPDKFEMQRCAQQTKLYEYALKCRRAITYLLNQPKTNGVSLLAVGCGVHVALMVLGVDTRVERASLLFGNLNIQYPQLQQSQEEQLDQEQDDLQTMLKYDEYKQMWLTGLAPQAYFQQVQTPMYVVLSANSPNVNLLQSDKTFRRANDKSRLFIAPTVCDYLNESCLDGVVKWLKNAPQVAKSEVESFVDEQGNYCLKVPSVVSIKKTALYYAVNGNDKVFYWRKANLVKADNCYVAKPDFFSANNEIVAFVVTQDDVTTSSSLFFDSVSVAKPKVVNNLIFSGNSNQLLVPFATNNDWLQLSLQYTLAKGYLDIEGAQGNALATFALCDSALGKKQYTSVSFDLCCKRKQQIVVKVVCNFGDGNEEYYQQVPVLGNETWERVTVDVNDLRKVEDNRQIDVNDRVDMLVISAESEFIVNNIILV